MFGDDRWHHNNMQYEQQNSLHTTLQSRYLYSLLELLLFASREAIKEGIESMRSVAHGIGTDLPAAIDEVQDTHTTDTYSHSHTVFCSSCLTLSIPWFNTVPSWYVPLF